MTLSTLLSNETVVDGDVITLRCRGFAESEALESLARALGQVHEQVLAGVARTVVVDVRALEFASSTALKAFVSWLQYVQELDDDRRYKVTFQSDPRHSWQRRSLRALAAFAAGVVEIETDTM